MSHHEEPIFVVTDELRLKPVCSATETSWKIGVLHEASLDIVLSIKQITNVLIRLRRCTVWSSLVLIGCNKVRFTYTATRTSLNNETLHEASYDLVLFNKGITKMLIRLCICTV